MATMSIDELNSFEPEKYIETYFKPMPISEERKEERRDAAKDFRDILLLILALIAIEYEKNLLDWAYIQEQFRKELLSTSLKYAAESEAIQDYVNTKSNDFIDTTKEQDLSDQYWTSDMRATHEAVNEANDVISISEMQRAEALGAVQKRWKTERDTKVRPTHWAVDGAVEDIDDMFRVGKDLMRFPHDWYYSAKESYNCRCGLDYLDENGKVVLVGKMKEEVNKNYNKVQFTSGHDNVTMDYKKDVRDEYRAETFITYNKGVEEVITAKPIKNSKNNIYVSDKVGTIKPRKLSDIESWITQSKRIVATKDANQPQIVIVSDTELLNTTGGRYNADKNVLYFKIMNDDADTKHSILHELFHWKDAQEYIKRGNSITAGEGFIADSRKRSKRILDKLGINEENAKGISMYAKASYKKGYYDEVYTEYRTVLREGEIK